LYPLRDFVWNVFGNALLSQNFHEPLIVYFHYRPLSVKSCGSTTARELSISGSELRPCYMVFSATLAVFYRWVEFFFFKSISSSAFCKDSI
jgi:hypothetical protein